MVGGWVIGFCGVWCFIEFFFLIVIGYYIVNRGFFNNIIIVFFMGKFDRFLVFVEFCGWFLIEGVYFVSLFECCSKNWGCFL